MDISVLKMPAASIFRAEDPSILFYPEDGDNCMFL
jgi:hypothetical protein